MSMLERVKSLLLGRGIPEEARKALEEAKSLTELRDKLDHVVTELEVVKSARVDREIETLSLDEEQATEQIGRGKLNDRQKQMALKKVQQVRKRIASYERQSSILQQKIDANLGILNRIQEMALMEQGNVLGVEQIDELAIKYSDVKESHDRYMEAEAALSGEVDDEVNDLRDQADLAALEVEIQKEYNQRHQKTAAAEKDFANAAEQAEQDAEGHALAEAEAELEEKATASPMTGKSKPQKEKPATAETRPSLDSAKTTGGSDEDTEPEEKRLETE